MTDLFLKNHEVPQAQAKTVATFLRSFFLSRKINHAIAPVLNKEMDDIKEVIMRSNSESYQKNLQFLKEQSKKLSLSTAYLEDICVSLTIYSELIFDYYAPAKTIYFLLEGDHFVCQHIQTRAIQRFGSKHKLTFVQLQYLTKHTLNAAHIDLIVTNYNRYLVDYKVKTDYLLLKSLPDDRDWEHLERKINPYQKPLF